MIEHLIEMATIHHETSFVVCDEVGDLGADPQGYFFEDVRCLSVMALTLEGERLVPLTLTGDGAGALDVFATNAKVRGRDRGELLVRRARAIEGALRETITVSAFTDASTAFELALRFEADFNDVYTVKSRAMEPSPGARPVASARVEDDGRRLVLERSLGATRCQTVVQLSSAAAFDGTSARFRASAKRGAPWTLTVDVTASVEHPDRRLSSPDLPKRRGDRAESLARGAATLESDHPVLSAAYAAAAADLIALRLEPREEHGGASAIAAGIPWYLALFGRDSLVAAGMALLHDPSLAAGTLRTLAHLQGSRVNPATDEEPGRIPHEYRRHLRPSAWPDVPGFPYYGTVDATPLFLVVLSEYVRVTGDLSLARDLWPHVERALTWIERYGDRDGDGLIEYPESPNDFLHNKGWKDSDGAVRFRDGRVASPPIALVEVQGYALDAYERAAELADLLGREGGARLRARADALRQQLVDRFWLSDRATFAEALDGRKRAVDSLSSNPGHLLWSRAIDEARARDVARALLGPEMFSGWGVRTLGSSEGGYNPILYQRGSVWPHDNALFLMGLARYGLRDEVARLSSALLDALGTYPSRRFPELFSGLPREVASRPVPYHGANEPQAWASASVMLLVRALLGLEVDAPRKRVSLSPARVPGMTWLRLANVPLGGSRVSIEARFAEGHPPAVHVESLPPGWTRG